jgi:Cytochrome P450
MNSKQTTSGTAISSQRVLTSTLSNGSYVGDITDACSDLHRSLSRDPAVYPDPDTFNPGRYLDPSYPTYREPLSEYPTIKGYHGFGFGRRICPGQEVAEAELLIACAALVWAFKLQKKRLPCGAEVLINDYDFTSTLITTAKPFDMEFVVRSENHAQKILERFQDVEAAEWNART